MYVREERSCAAVMFWRSMEVCRALLSVCKALLSVCRALLSVCRALLSACV